MTADNQNLPKLPEPDIHAPFLKEAQWVYQGDYFLASKMLEYGDARAAHARKQALEEAIEIATMYADLPAGYSVNKLKELK